MIVITIFLLFVFTPWKSSNNTLSERRVVPQKVVLQKKEPEPVPSSTHIKAATTFINQPNYEKKLFEFCHTHLTIDDYHRRRQYGSAGLPDTEVFTRSEKDSSHPLIIVLDFKEETNTNNGSYRHYVGKTYTASMDYVYSIDYYVFLSFESRKRYIGVSKGTYTNTAISPRPASVRDAITLSAFAGNISECLDSLSYALNNKELLLEWAERYW